MIVVSDTSPINYLPAIGQVEVLPKLFGTIIIPATVMAALRRTTFFGSEELMQAALARAKKKPGEK